MDAVSTGADPTASKWRKFADFPLVAMIFAVALFAGAIGISLLIYKLLPPGSTPALTAAKVAILIGLELAAYKLVIRHLGEQRRDDLPWRSCPQGAGDRTARGLIALHPHRRRGGPARVYNIVGEGGTSDLVMIALTISIMPGFMEELFFRGILFRCLEQFGGSWFALALTSALFGIAHIFNPNASAIVVLRDRARGRHAAGRSLYADPTVCGCRWPPRCVELHAGLHLRRAGVGNRPGRHWSRPSCRDPSFCPAALSASKRR